MAAYKVTFTFKHDIIIEDADSEETAILQAQETAEISEAVTIEDCWTYSAKIVAPNDENDNG